MKYKDNILELAGLQADYIGFIFYEKSPRFVGSNTVSLSEEIKKVGVFVNASMVYITEKIIEHDLELIQLHGQESPEFCRSLKSQINTEISDKDELAIIKVFTIKDEFDFDVLKAYEEACDYYLFDTKGKLPGGNGYAFDWNILLDYPSTKPYFLSGGIGLDQIEALRAFKNSKAAKHCYAIDVNSKFETEPGLKNIAQLTEFKAEL